jgi:hypothetical protein
MTTLANSNAGGNAITRPQASGRTILAGEDAEDTLIPRIHIYQGLPEERENFGPHEPGAFINTITKDETPNAPFVPIFGWVEYIKFNEPRGSGIAYRTRNKSEVAPEDLEFRDRPDGKKGPACTKFINFAVLFAGNPEPMVLSFKSTSLNAGRTLNTLEKMRGSKGPGLYQVELDKKRNSKGAWLSPRIRPLGNPTPEDLELAEAFANSLSPETVKTNLDDSGADEGEGGGFDPNAQ